MANEVLRDGLLLHRGEPAASTLEDDRIHLEVAFRSPGAEHRELLRLDQILENETSSRVLVHASPCPCHAFGESPIELRLTGFADGFGAPVVRGGVAVGVEDFGLEVAEKALCVRTGVAPTES